MEVNEGDHGISFDGDADRIVYFYRDKGDKLTNLSHYRIADIFLWM